MAQKPYSNTAAPHENRSYIHALGGYNNHRDMVVSLKCEIVLKASRPQHYCDIDECNTLGDHLRRKRLHSDTSQGCVAQMLSVETDTITNWELNRNSPHVKYTPNIVRYLGYIPLFNLAGNSLSKRLEQYMFTNGLTQKECAKKLGVDSGTLGRTIEERNVNHKTRDKLQSKIVFPKTPNY